jgi:hypothetical protein
VQQSAIPPTAPTTSRADKIRDWSKTLGIALLVIPFPAALLYAAFTMPGMP